MLFMFTEKLKVQVRNLKYCMTQLLGREKECRWAISVRNLNHKSFMFFLGNRSKEEREGMGKWAGR